VERRTFIQAAVVAVILLLGLNRAVGWMGRNAVPRVIVRHAHSSTAFTDAFLGNSIVRAGVSEAAWSRTAAIGKIPSRPVNLGLGWSTPAEHAVLWDELLKTGNHPKRIFYGFFDLQLQEYTNSVWWALGGNMAMGYFVDPELSAKYHAPGSRLGHAFMQAASHVPLFTERITFWGKVEELRRKLAAIGLKSAPSNPEAKDGATKDEFSAFMADSSDAFARHCENVVRENAPFHPAIDDIIESATRIGCKVYFVEIPMTPEHRRLFYARPAWTAYKAWLRGRLEVRHAALIEAGDWVTDPTEFHDSLHLDATGAARFTERLFRETARLDTGSVPSPP
jgi:hypothetical protein